MKRPIFTKKCQGVYLFDHHVLVILNRTAGEAITTTEYKDKKTIS